MKFLRRLGFILVLFFVLFGSISIPQKTFAAEGDVCDYTDYNTRDGIVKNGRCTQKTNPISSAEYNDLKRFTEQIKSSTNETLGINIVADKYLSILENSYNSLKNDPSGTKNKVEVQALTAFKQYLVDEQLKGQSLVTGSISRKLLEQLIIIVDQKLARAGANLRVETGLMTEAERDEQGKNADQRAKDELQKLKDKEAKECSALGNNSVANCLDAGLTWIIKTWFLQLAGFLVWLSANMLNLSIQIGILNFADWSPKSLYDIWLVVRQITSLFVVFAGLWLGAMWIIGKDDKFKKYIPWVVIFALFINFSYPLTRVVIDVSNAISLNIYSSAVGTKALTGAGADTAGALIMERMGLQGLALSATSGKSAQYTDVIASISSTPGALLAIIFILYAAYVFFMAAALIMARTAILALLIVASPLLFVDSMIPKLGEYAAKMRELFFSQLVVAPVFMLMLALTLKFLEVFGTSSGDYTGPIATSAGSFATLAGSGEKTLTTFFSIIMMIIMLHIMLKVTKKVSGDVGQFATKYMGMAGGMALGVASGGTGLLARASIGRGAAALRESSWIKNNQDSFLGRSAYNMSNSLANSTFDARNTDIVGKNMGKIGMGMGTGNKLGYDQALKATVDDRVARYGRIKTENDDGTINMAGARAKQRFYSTGGVGFSDNRTAVQKAFKEKDTAEANDDNRKVATYNKLTGDKRQNNFYSQTPSVKNEMLGMDKARAGLVDNYLSAKVQQDRAKIFEELSPEEQDYVKRKDREEADRFSAARNQTGANTASAGGQTSQPPLSQPSPATRGSSTTTTPPINVQPIKNSVQYSVPQTPLAQPSSATRGSSTTIVTPVTINTPPTPSNTTGVARTEMEDYYGKSFRTLMAEAKFTNNQTITPVPTTETAANEKTKEILHNIHEKAKKSDGQNGEGWNAGTENGPKGNTSPSGASALIA
jgi:hypothetical protein